MSILAVLGGIVIVAGRVAEAVTAHKKHEAGDKDALLRPPRRSPRSHGSDGPDY